VTAPPADQVKDISLRVKQCALLEIWGQLVFRPGDVIYDVVKVAAPGDALELQLRLEPEGDQQTLEIARPRKVKVDQGRLEIGEAASVRWAGEEIKPQPGSKKPALVLA
jgi:hypothetical protein